MLCNVSVDFNFIQWPCEFVWRVRKPVLQCNHITNYHAKLKTKATTQNGAPISKCKRNEKPFATSIEWNRTANGSGVERRGWRICAPAIAKSVSLKNRNMGTIVQCYFMCRTTADDDVHTAHAHFVRRYTENCMQVAHCYQSRGA